MTNKILATPYAKECAPKVWRKFTDKEKELWVKFYRAFLTEHNFPLQWGDDEDGYADYRKITAHNMACTAVWELQSDPDIKILLTKKE